MRDSSKKRKLIEELDLLYFIFEINTLWLATFVIPAKPVPEDSSRGAGIQKCKVLSDFWIPDQQTSGMTVVDTPSACDGEASLFSPYYLRSFIGCIEHFE